MRFRRHNQAQATVREAIEYLASACDGAVRRDGHGFSRDHVQLGHALARQKAWTRRDRRLARAIAGVYSTQLTTAGFGAPTRNQGAAAGWRKDPTGVHRLRYWNGARWTAWTAD